MWRIGRVDAFRPKGHGFDSPSSRHVGTLGKSLTHNWVWRFGMKFRNSIRAVLGAPLCSSGRGAIEMVWMNEWMKNKKEPTTMNMKINKELLYN